MDATPSLVNLASSRIRGHESSNSAEVFPRGLPRVDLKRDRILADAGSALTSAEITITI